MCHEQLGSVSALICRPYGLLNLGKKKKNPAAMMAWRLQISLPSQDVRAPNGNNSEGEAGVCGCFEKEHGETLAQMVTTSFGVSRDKPRSDAHSCEREECVRAGLESREQPDLCLCL